MQLELLGVLQDWREEYGSENSASLGDSHVISGASLQIALYSCEWWIQHCNQINNESNNGPQRIVGAIARYLIKRDIKGAIIHGIAHIIKTANDGDDINWEDVGWSALRGGISSGTFGLL